MDKAASVQPPRSVEHELRLDVYIFLQGEATHNPTQQCSVLSPPSRLSDRVSGSSGLAWARYASRVDRAKVPRTVLSFILFYVEILKTSGRLLLSESF